jgi:hypothetical protein
MVEAGGVKVELPFLTRSILLLPAERTLSRTPSQWSNGGNKIYIRGSILTNSNPSPTQLAVATAIRECMSLRAAHKYQNLAINTYIAKNVHTFSFDRSCCVPAAAARPLSGPPDLGSAALLC